MTQRLILEDQQPPREMYEAFRRVEQPLSAVWIGWSETPSTQAAQYSIAGQHLAVDAVEPTSFYQVLLLIGCVFFGSFYAHHPEVVIQYNFPRESYTPIWPTERDVVWPTAQPVDRDTLFAWD